MTSRNSITGDQQRTKLGALSNYDSVFSSKVSKAVTFDEVVMYTTFSIDGVEYKKIDVDSGYCYTSGDSIKLSSGDIVEVLYGV